MARMKVEEIVEEIRDITKSIKIAEDSVDDFDAKEYLKLIRCKLIYLNDEIGALSEPTTITENMINGIEEGIRCAMCTNPMKSDSGCEGHCVINRTMYKKVLDVINNVLYKGNFTMPTCEDKLEQIRAEIKDLHKSHMINFVSADGAVDTCLEIIDKYSGKRG